MRPASLLAASAMLLTAATVGWANGAASQPAANDLRDLRVGMALADVPATGYVDLACAADPGRKLASWSEFASCPADGRGLHEVRFAYDEASNPLGPLDDKYQGTKVAGHPVLLTLLVGDDRRVDGLEIETDPKARLYLRKKAFLFASQAKARYGVAGWDCAGLPPAEGEEPVGGVFVNERSEKVADGRRLIVERRLLRHAGQPIKDFVGDSRLTILRVG